MNFIFTFFLFFTLCGSFTPAFSSLTSLSSPFLSSPYHGGEIVGEDSAIGGKSRIVTLKKFLDRKMFRSFDVMAFVLKDKKRIIMNEVKHIYWENRPHTFFGPCCDFYFILEGNDQRIPMTEIKFLVLKKKEEVFVSSDE